MLCLSLRSGESIMIGDDIRVTVTYISRYKIRIAIEAPPETKILREELLADERWEIANPQNTHELMSAMFPGVEFLEDENG